MGRVSGKSAALLKHFNPLHLFPERQTADDFLQKGQRFPLLSYISPLPDTCQFYVRGLGMPVIVLQHENDVNFPTGPFSVRRRRQSSWQFLQRCQHITSFTELLPCSSAQSVVPWRVIEGEKIMMSSFQHGSKSLSYYASALSSGRWWWWWWWWLERWWWWWWRWSVQWSWWWWQWRCNLP